MSGRIVAVLAYVGGSRQDSDILPACVQSLVASMLAEYWLALTAVVYLTVTRVLLSMSYNHPEQ